MENTLDYDNHNNYNEVDERLPGMDLVQSFVTLLNYFVFGSVIKNWQMV